MLVIGLIVILPFLVPCKWRVFLVLPLGVFQVYLPLLTLGGAPISLAFIVGASFWRELAEKKAILLSRPLFAIVVLAAIVLLSLLWSSDVRLGLAGFSQIMVFVLTACGCVYQARRDHRWVIRAFTALFCLSVVQMASVIVFRLNPDVKMVFLQSQIAKIFINENVLEALFMEGRNNVFDVVKSGGFGFVNGNAASAFAGLLVMAAIGLASAYRKRSYYIFAFTAFGSIYFTGSKAGLILMLALPIVAFTLIYMRRTGRRYRMFLPLAMGLIGVVAFSMYETVGLNSGNEFGGAVEDTTEVRLVMWNYAVSAFFGSPILGQGFGGWQEGFAPYANRYGFSQVLPPHNTFIYLWSQSGILAVAVGVWFSAILFKLSIRKYDDKEARGVAFALGFGFLWLTIQGMGENFGLLGDNHMIPVLAGLLALALVRLKRKTKVVPHGKPTVEAWRGGDSNPTLHADGRPEGLPRTGFLRSCDQGRRNVYAASGD
ncbi:hypothetical protein LMG26411_01144 [Cupriavidus numazuensis]|uniref:O-antigen ligase-related domain-containing protein n=2 Tax=Cupriavidus numazuensis TaxID=221992 RepID=A0ABM8TCD4_9BURK|nr:hypothetical protein LMG26411_01144 [Cupriavidus numazuensis]